MGQNRSTVGMGGGGCREFVGISKPIHFLLQCLGNSSISAMAIVEMPTFRRICDIDDIDDTGDIYDGESIIWLGGSLWDPERCLVRGRGGGVRIFNEGDVVKLI